MAYSNGKNPFMDDDDLFLVKARSGVTDSRSGSRFDSDFRDPPLYEEDADELRGYGAKQQQMQQSMNRQLDTTQRCLASIYDSEQIGIATAEVGLLCIKRVSLSKSILID